MALVIPKNIRLQLRSQIAQARFPLCKRKAIENILTRAVRQYRVLRQHSPVAHKPTLIPNKRRSVGRPAQSLQRNLLIAALYRAWMLGFDEHPTVSNKRDVPSKFFYFAEAILRREGVGKTLRYLEEFQSYRKQQMISSSFTVVRGKVM